MYVYMMDAQCNRLTLCYNCRRHQLVDILLISFVLIACKCSVI